MSRLKPSEIIDRLSKAKSINLDELAADMLEAFGGPRGYAEKCFKEYQNESTPPVARAKILEGVRHLAVAAASKNKGVDDMSGATEEELYEAVEIVTGKHGGDDGLSNDGTDAA